MTSTIRTLLLSTALTVPAASAVMAQESGMNACGTLQEMMQSDQLQGMDLDETAVDTAIAEGDTETCQTWVAELRDQGVRIDGSQASEEGRVAETDRTTVTLQEEAVVEGTVYLERTPPNVNIEGGDAEVNVTEAEPEVTVREGQPQIVVRQASPSITVDMPRPTIRIEQPAPEIIVTMPDPEVDVASARPQVEVRQGEPNITVTQSQPRVDLELRRVEEGEESGGFQVSDSATGETYEAGQPGGERQVTDAQINMAANQPTVNYSREEGQQQQASISIERSDPSVRFETAEPNVEISSAGEPQVEWIQSGEPQVTYQDAAAGDAATQGQESEQTDQASAGEAMSQEGSEETAQAGGGTTSDQGSEGALDQAVEESVQAAENAAEQAGQAAEAAGEAVEETMAEVGREAEQGAEETAQMARETTDGSAAPAESASETSQMASGAQDAFANGPDVSLAGYNTATLETLRADRLTDQSIFGLDGSQIGGVGDIVLTDEGEIRSLVVEIGGFLGLGRKQVAVPLSDVTILQSTETDDIRVYTSYDEQDLEAMEDIN